MKKESEIKDKIVGNPVKSPNLFSPLALMFLCSLIKMPIMLVPVNNFTKKKLSPLILQKPEPIKNDDEIQ